MPGQNCDVDGWYKFDTQCPGGNVSGGEKIPNNCSAVANKDGTPAYDCRRVSAKEACEHKGWGNCESYPSLRVFRNPPSSIVPLLRDLTWNPYGPGDPRR